MRSLHSIIYRIYNLCKRINFAGRGKTACIISWEVRIFRGLSLDRLAKKKINCFHVSLRRESRSTASAQRIPSTAAETIPPAYPAPSPQGYSPPAFGAVISFVRTIRTGEEDRLSTAVSSASGLSNPRRCPANRRTPCSIDSVRNGGRQRCKSV